VEHGAKVVYMRKIGDHIGDHIDVLPCDPSRACARVLHLRALTSIGLTCMSASILGALAGCSTPIHRAPEPAFFHAGRSVDLRPDATFFPADPRVLAVEDQDIATRAQDRLAYRDEPTLFDLEAWPPPTRPSLSNRRSLYISDRPTSYLYFERSNQRSHHSSYRGHTLFQPVPVFDPRR
jgi:hypothetical protein